MTLPNVTVAKLKRAATENSYSRGKLYFDSGAVSSVTLRQRVLSADVEGSEAQPYQTTIAFDDGGITEARCTCPYSFDGWCKHIVATLLVCIHEPKTIVERPPLSQLLEPLNLEQTKTLIQSLVSEAPALMESVDFYVSQWTQTKEKSGAAAPKTSKKRKATVNPAPYRRRARRILQEAVTGWNNGEDYDSIADDFAVLIKEALRFAEQGDSANALIVLKGITDGCLQSWHIVEDFMGMSPDEFGVSFDVAWAEVLLSVELTKDETLTWQQELEVWQDSLGSFEMAIAALHQGWDYPPLQRVFRGEIKAGAWEAEAPSWADEFCKVRLKILDRHERYQDYLYLAEAEGQVQNYLTMLVRLGQIDQAMDEASTLIVSLPDAIALAEILRSQQRLPETLKIAMQGLRLEDERNAYLKPEFALWTRSLAEGLGDRAAVLEASQIGFAAKPSLVDYQAIQDCAGEDWPDIKERLLEQLLKMNSWTNGDAQIDILLHENLVDVAVKKVSGKSLGSYFGGYLDRNLLRVMDAAIASHSQWVIQNAAFHAEAIVNAKKANYYSHAIEWLKRVKDAYLTMGKEKDWLRYRRQLADTHGRKRKFMGLLEASRL
jgi:uncharacterized Zn finger protein